MKNNPNKATIEEITRLYHYTILPLLVETDLFFKSMQIKRTEINHLPGQKAGGGSHVVHKS